MEFAAEHRNEVLLVGRLSAAAATRDLPSGDAVTSWRLVVDRASRGPDVEPVSTEGRERRTVDTLECATFRPEVARAVECGHPGDIFEVRGALRRRFWRSPQGVASRYEIEAAGAKRVSSVQSEQEPETRASS